MEDNILTDGAIKKMTLNTLFERYMATRELADTTRVSYVRAWENRVKDEIGNIKVVQLLPSHIKAYYAKLSKAGYAYSTIKYIHNLLYPALEMAVDDDIIRKNPAKSSISDYGKPAEESRAVTKVFSSCNASHSLYQNGRVPYGRKSSSIYYGTRSYRCNNGSVQPYWIADKD